MDQIIKSPNHPEARFLVPMVLAKHGVCGIVTHGIYHKRQNITSWVVHYDYNNFYIQYVTARKELLDKFKIDIICNWREFPSRM